MFWKKSANNDVKVAKTSDVTTPTIYIMSWDATVEGPKGFLAAQWGQIRYDSTTDTVNMQYMTNYSDAEVEVVVKNGISIVEAMAEISKLQQNNSTREWCFNEKTWQGPLYNAAKILGLLGFRSRTPAPKEIKSYREVAVTA